MVGEREILASLVEFKHHSMAEMIRNEKEEEKTKVDALCLTKKDKKAPNFKEIALLKFGALTTIILCFILLLRVRSF